MSHLDIAGMPALKKLPIGIVGIVGPAGALFILAGMLRFWYRVDRTRRWAKWFWLVVMLAAFPWGSAVYFLVVYIPQVVRFNRLGV